MSDNTFFTTWFSVVRKIFTIGYSYCSDSQEISHILWNLGSQELSIGPCLEPDESSTQLQILFLQNTFQFYPFTDILVKQYCFWQWRTEGGGLGCSNPPRNSEDNGEILDHVSKKNRRLDFLL